MNKYTFWGIHIFLGGNLSKSSHWLLNFVKFSDLAGIFCARKSKVVPQYALYGSGSLYQG
jgi:hypothetical protein